jgi:hypothetical protein
MLHLAGDLDRTIGGPSIPSKASDSRRRSLYFTRTPEEVPGFLAPFDAPNVLDCYRRAESIVPQQALALSNSKLALNSAGKIAAWIVREAGGKMSDAAFIQAAYETVLSVQPTTEEQAECESALVELRQLHASKAPAEANSRAQTGLIHVLLNHNDFVTLR